MTISIASGKVMEVNAAPLAAPWRQWVASTATGKRKGGWIHAAHEQSSLLAKCLFARWRTVVYKSQVSER